MCNFNMIVVLEYISRDLYLLFAIRFSSKFQNSVFYQHMRPKSGLQSPRPLKDYIYQSSISEPCCEKSIFRISSQALHKPDRAATEYGL